MIPNAPDARNLYLGAGNVYFDLFDANGVSTGMRHLGNVDTLELVHAVEMKEKKSSMVGTRSTYAEVPVGSSAEISIAINEYVPENVALATMGKKSYYTQAANAAVADKAVGPIAANVQLDVWYDLGALNPDVDTVKQGATTLDIAAYELNAEAGMIRLLSSFTGANKAVAATAITWSGSIPAIVEADKRMQVHALAQAKIRGRLRFIGAADQAAGPRCMVDIWLCGINPDGALALITEDWGTFNLKGKAFQDTSEAVGEQFYRLLYL